MAPALGPVLLVFQAFTLFSDSHKPCLEVLLAGFGIFLGT